MSYVVPITFDFLLTHIYTHANAKHCKAGRGTLRSTYTYLFINSPAAIECVNESKRERRPFSNLDALANSV